MVDPPGAGKSAVRACRRTAGARPRGGTDRLKRKRGVFLFGSSRLGLIAPAAAQVVSCLSPMLRVALLLLSAASASCLRVPPVAAGQRAILPYAARRCADPRAAVADISSTAEFEAALKDAGDALVVVDYSTSWCGPCKIIAPKYDEMSEKYTSVKFLKVCARARELESEQASLGGVGGAFSSEAFRQPAPLLRSRRAGLCLRCFYDRAALAALAATLSCSPPPTPATSVAVSSSPRKTPLTWQPQISAGHPRRRALSQPSPRKTPRT